MTTRILLLLSFAGCSTADDTDVNDADTTPEVTAACRPVVDEAFASRRIDAAEYRCEENDCTLELPESEPTRPWARGYPSGDMLVMDAFDSPELIVATGGLVHGVTVPGANSFQASDGLVWLVLDQSEVLAMNGEGTVTQRCELPEEMAFVASACHVAGRLLVSGITEDRQTLLVQATDTGWQTLPTEVYPDGFRELAGDEVIGLAYGYAEWRDLSTGETQLLGGSDDDFSGVAVCADGSYWIGGMTGLTMLCGADHVCEFMRNDGYPFQSQAIGCDARGWLWWRVDAFDDQPVQRGILTTDGDLRYIEAASGFRTGWEHYGRRWTVMDLDED